MWEFYLAGCEISFRYMNQMVFQLQLARRQNAAPLTRDYMLDAEKGIKVTRLGNRHRAEAVIRAEDPRGRPVYWIGPAGAGQDAGPGTDFHAVAEGYVSVTPLTVDLTNHAAPDELRTWVGPGA